MGQGKNCYEANVWNIDENYAIYVFGYGIPLGLTPGKNIQLSLNVLEIQNFGKLLLKVLQKLWQPNNGVILKSKSRWQIECQKYYVIIPWSHHDGILMVKCNPKFQ